MWLLLAPVAHACSVACGTFADPALVLPVDGASGVPVDATPVVSDVRAPGLIDPEGTELDVALVVLDATLTRLVPSRPLRPDTPYTVFDDGFGTDRVAVGSFATGPGPATGEPGAPVGLSASGVSSGDLWPGRKGLTAMCGNLGDGVWLDVSWEPVTGLYEVEASRKHLPPTLILVAGEAAALGWETPCLSTLPDLRPGEDVSIRVRALDEAGRPGPFSDELFTSVRDARPGPCATGSTGTGPAWIVALLVLRSRRRRPPSGRCAVAVAQSPTAWISSRTSGCRWRRRARW